MLRMTMLRLTMLRLTIATSLLLLAPTADFAMAGKYNQVLSIGDSAPAWTGLIGVDDMPHSMDELAAYKVLVVVFTCNSCPYAIDAEDRLVALQKEYAGRGVALIAINVNKVEEDLLPAMKTKAQEKEFAFPYLFDETQQIGRDFGAIVTPQCFVLDSQRKVRYMGSIDDSPDGRNVQERHLERAIDSVLAGRDPELAESIPIGCQIRYDRKRSSRRSDRKNE